MLASHARVDHFTIAQTLNPERGFRGCEGASTSNCLRRVAWLQGQRGRLNRGSRPGFGRLCCLLPSSLCAANHCEMAGKPGSVLTFNLEGSEKLSIKIPEATRCEYPVDDSMRASVCGTAANAVAQGMESGDLAVAMQRADGELQGPVSRGANPRKSSVRSCQAAHAAYLGGSCGCHARTGHGGVCCEPRAHFV